MCRAKIADAGAPFITATVILPEYEISQDVPFLIDTGADNTSLDGITSLQMGLHPTLSNPSVDIIENQSQGVGGETDCHLVAEEVWLAFEEEDDERELWSLHIEHLNNIQILPDSPANLLGRNVINRFSMEYEPSAGYVQLDRDDFGGGRYECLTFDEQPTEQLELGNGET